MISFLIKYPKAAQTTKKPILVENSLTNSEFGPVKFAPDCTDQRLRLPSPKRLPSARLLEAGLRAGREFGVPIPKLQTQFANQKQKNPFLTGTGLGRT